MSGPARRVVGIPALLHDEGGPRNRSGEYPLDRAATRALFDAVADASPARPQPLGRGEARAGFALVAVRWTGWPRSEADAALGEAEEDPGGALGAILAAGLERREGRLLLPPAVARPDAALDYIIWRVLSAARRGLGGDAGRLRVCESCSLVFEPRGRKRKVRFCPPCGRSESVRPVPGVLGLPPWDGRPVRVPRLDGRVIVGWDRAYWRACATCGDEFWATRADHVLCEEHGRHGGR